MDRKNLPAASVLEVPNTVTETELSVTVWMDDSFTRSDPNTRNSNTFGLDKA